MRKTLLSTLILAGILAVLGLAACEDAPLAPGEPAFLIDPASPVPSAGAAVVQSVTGNGHLVSPTVSRTYTVSVLKLADGTVTGWFHVNQRGRGGAHVRVAVDCLHVNGNRAWAGGVVVDAFDPANIGLPYSFRVVDNGEGGNAAPDEIVTVRHSWLDCTTEWDLGTRPLTSGNLQVRG